MRFIVLLYCHLFAVCWSQFFSDVRTGISIAPLERLRADSLVAVPIGSRYETYPAIESFGSVYLPNGDLILNTGDVVFASGKRLTDLMQYTIDIGLRLCGITQPCAFSTMIFNISSCACECRSGYTGIDCTIPDCNNNGNWTLSGCVCSFPYTSKSMCTVADCGSSGQWNGTQCVCWPPYTGTLCNIMPPLAEISRPTSCLVDGVFSCPDINNHGVAACSAISRVCMCPPAYRPTLGQIIQRSYSCVGNFSQCVAQFNTLASACCLGLLGCGQKYGPAYIQPRCSDQVCCQAYLAKYQCEFNGCVWGPYYTCVASQPLETVVGTWLEETVDCAATPSSILCDYAAQSQQMDIIRSVGGNIAAAFFIIQQHAWHTISTYSQWDDGIPHSIVLSLSGSPPMRLFANWESPVWSTLSWAPASVPVAPQRRSFQFELVTKSARLPAYRLGSAYRIWVWGTTSCLLDYSLGADQLVYFGAQTPTNNSLVLVELSATSIDISVEDCGVFYVDDSVISTHHTMPTYISATSSAATLVPAINSQAVVTTPSVYQDSTPSFVYSVDPVAIAVCRYLYCKLDLIIGACSSTACAMYMVGDTALWAVCKPCIAAHVPFSIV